MQKGPRSRRKMAEVCGELEIGLVVKAAGRFANLRACRAERNPRLLAVHRSEQSLFHEAVFRPDLYEPIWQEIEQLAGSAIGLDLDHPGREPAKELAAGLIRINCPSRLTLAGQSGAARPSKPLPMRS